MHSGLYVSDILEDLLQASTVREITRSITVDAIGSLHPKVDAITEYIGGKCMGYPSIWLFQKAVNLNPSQLRTLLSKNYSALFISLSTSIGDDLVDKDEDADIAHLGLLYLLLFKAFAKQPSKNLGQMILENGLSVMRDMLDAKLENVPSSHDFEKMGNKIGLFHKMITYELATALGRTNVNVPLLVELSGQFGCWCSEVDDFIDIERDIESGQYFTRPILTLLNSGVKIRRAVIEKDFHTTNDTLASSAFISQNIDSLVHRLQTITDNAYGNGYMSLGLALDEILIKLPDRLHKIRTIAHDIYLNKNGPCKSIFEQLSHK